MSLRPRYFAAAARKRPCVGPSVADRSSGRLGTIRGAVRSASRARRTLRTVVRERLYAFRATRSTRARRCAEDLFELPLAYDV